MVIGKPHARSIALRIAAAGTLGAVLAVVQVAFWMGEACAQTAARTSAPPVAEAASPTVAVAAVDPRLDSAEGAGRFTLSLSAEVAITFDHLVQPLRIVAELPEVSFQASRAPKPASGLVSGFRAGLVAPGRSRIVFELSSPARVSSARQVRRADGIVDLAIEFEPMKPAEFEAVAAKSAESRALAALAPLASVPSGDNRRPLVVIDAGHGGIDSGAVAAGGVAEKALVLEIALRLRDHLEAAGGVRVLLTRADDRFLSLSERVRVAREARADLFISLHADSLSAAQEVRGATIYTGSERATDAESARLAQKENASDALAGAEAGQGGEEVLDILMDLARRETRAMSGSAAARLVTEMSGAVRMHRIPQRAAGFRVLTAPDVPSILIELGFLSSKGDIALMTSEAWQKTAAAAIGRAVTGHFAAKIPASRRGASISP